MQRYQVYLNPQSVAVLDDFEGEANVSRSKIIQGLVERLAVNLLAVYPSTKKTQPRRGLDRLIGIIKVPGDKKTDYASRADDIYLQD